MTLRGVIGVGGGGRRKFPFKEKGVLLWDIQNSPAKIKPKE